MATAAEIAKEKAKAKTAMTESIRDLLSMKVKLPLGNPALKQVHTNQFCWIQLPEDFELANMKIISKALHDASSRLTGATYDKNRWYIEGITINNDGDNFTMDLDLNPFASSISKYRDNRLKYEKEYKDTYEKKTTTTTSSNNGVASVGGTNTTLKGGQGKVIDNIAKKAVGTETRPYWKAVKVHNYLKQFIRYSGYECTRYGTPEKCWNNRSHLNCADTARLTTAVMRSAGLNAQVVWAPGHFWTVVFINGKEYASDLTGSSGSLSRRSLGQVWRGMRYTRREGASPHC